MPWAEAVRGRAASDPSWRTGHLERNAGSQVSAVRSATPTPEGRRGGWVCERRAVIRGAISMCTKILVPCQDGEDAFHDVQHCCGLVESLAAGLARCCCDGLAIRYGVLLHSPWVHAFVGGDKPRAPPDRQDIGRLRASYGWWPFSWSRPARAVPISRHHCHLWQCRNLQDSFHDAIMS
jgi:hypothetical protein